ncbi:MAG TPA: radical SAM protein, partial [Acidobacteriota bacterium]
MPRDLRVFIDTTDRCNLRCIMCAFALEEFSGNWNAREQSDGDMPLWLFEKIAAQTLPRASYLALSCGTEPLMSRTFLDCLERVAPYGVPQVEFPTNATLLTQAKAERVVKARPHVIMVSLDSPDPATFEAIRPGARFDKVIANVRGLQEIKRRLGTPNPELRLNLTLMRRNVEQLEDYIELARNLGAARIDIRHVNPFDGLGMERESLVHFKALANRHLERARRRCLEYGIAIARWPEPFDLSGAAHPTAPLACQSVMDSLYINPAGQVVPCAWWLHEPPIGDFKSQDLDQILSAPALLEARALAARGELKPCCAQTCAVRSANVNDPAFFDSLQIG